MHMLIRNFLCQMQCNPPPADTTAQLLLREQQQEELIHSKMVKENFTDQIFWVLLAAGTQPDTERCSSEFRVHSSIKK